MGAKEIIKESAEISAKTALSLIPFGGGTLVTCVWDSIKANTAQKRMNEWKNLIEDRLHTIETTLEDIGNNELFASAMMKATDSALRTAEQTKREYLANVVRNSVLVPVEESRLMMFLDMIDRNTAWHLAVLQFFRDPTQGGKRNANHYYMGAPSTVLQEALPEICKNMDMVRKIVRDLQQDGLLHQGDFLNTTMTAQGMVTPRTTEFGNEFLDYITLNN